MSNTSNNGAAISRSYGIERSLGDILYNPNTKSVFATLKLGVFHLPVSLNKRDDGQYDLLVPYTDKNGQAQTIKLGQSFPVTDKNKNVVNGLSKAALSLIREYDPELKKEVNRNNDALYITIHKLKETKKLGESGLMKVGYITGQIGVEIGDTKGDRAHEAADAQGVDAQSENSEEVPF